jgi:Domain of Unknown Function (DUF1080)
MKKMIAVYFMFVFFNGYSQQNAMKPLFNGKDLKGWYSFLKSKGKDNDPEKVFSVENGMIHITGKEFGYICYPKEYTNFHLVAEFKWGVKKYPPRDADTTKRDNGICYYIPMDVRDTVWPKSIEFQIQEGDVGDIWMIDQTTMMVNGVRSKPDSFARVFKKKNGEHPTGEWNKIELIANKGKITYIVNGVVVNEGEDPSLTKGKILVQSEGAEIYYRKIEIEELK